MRHSLFSHCTCRAALLPIVLCAGCPREPDVNEHRVRAAVREYNLVLPRAYRDKRPEALSAVATAAQVNRVWTLVLGLSQRNRVLDARQESMRVQQIALKGENAAQLTATDVWWYRHVDPRNGKVAQPPRRVETRVRYTLVQQQGRWLVDKLDVLQSKDLPIGDAG